ncbi:MAG: glycosyl transferase family 2, partial [Candidatus Omnitrophica bacterium]|nr:glycosyl transferase family 2 [Candidatus Omnitrophota bacterium]
DKEGWATEVAEKRVISEDATVGIYAFSRGKDFVKAADSMIAKNLRVNGEFYIAPVYNELIGWKARVAAFPIGTLGVQMHGMGTPEDLTAFLDTQVSQRAAAKVRETYAPA